MRKFLLMLVALIALTSVTASAIAAGVTLIEATEDNIFVPDAVVIAVGDTVQWDNIGGFHNVVIELPGGDVRNGEPAFPPWTFSYTFTKAGSFYFYCEPHQSVGMDGTVTVVDPTAVTLSRLESAGSDSLVAGVALLLMAGAGLLLISRRL